MDDTGEKPTMTLNLADTEVCVLDDLSAQEDLSRAAILRRARRLYHLLDARLSAGAKLFFEDETKKTRAELMVPWPPNRSPLRPAHPARSNGRSLTSPGHGLTTTVWSRSGAVAGQVSAPAWI